MSFDLRRGSSLDPIAGLASLADRSVDHVITDPPYSDHVHANQARRNDGEDGTKKHSLKFEPIKPEERKAFAVQYARLVKRWVLVFCEVEGASAWREDLEAAGLNYVREGAWIREGTQPQTTGDRPAQGHEAIVIAHQAGVGRMKWNGGGRPAIWSFPVVRGKRHHATEKPLLLMEALVREFTDLGDLVLDSHAGSATTGVAALHLGRRFVGWELEGANHAVALSRLAGTKEQFDLVPRAPKPKQVSLIPKKGFPMLPGVTAPEQGTDGSQAGA